MAQSHLKTLVTLASGRHLSQKLLEKSGICKLSSRFWSSSNDSDASNSNDAYRSQGVQFSANRSRDLMGKAFELQQENEMESKTSQQEGQVEPPRETESAEDDKHVDSYDSRGGLSLSSVMQTMVPEPFSTQGKKGPSHFNMPGGSVLQGQKYLSDDLHNTHYRQGTKEFCTFAKVANVDGRGPVV